MFRYFVKLLVSIGLWSYFKGRIGQYSFLIVGIFVLWYLAGEAEQFLQLTDKQYYLAYLLVIKNILYLFVLMLFLLWPFIFRKIQHKNRTEINANHTVIEVNKESNMKGDGFDKIRARGAARSASEIELDSLDK